MTSNFIDKPRRFPAPALLLDANVLIRFGKCGNVQALAGLGQLEAASSVLNEFSTRPADRAALRSLSIVRRSLIPGSEEWNEFCLLRGEGKATRDLGEDESIAICLADAKRGRILPFATFDRRPGRRAQELSIVVLDFLAVLCFLCTTGTLTIEQADKIETLAARINGWRRPQGCPVSIESLIEPTIERISQEIMKNSARFVAK